MNTEQIKLEGEEFLLGVCPECKGLALVLHYEPTDETRTWSNRVSAQRMIEYLQTIGLGNKITRKEYRFAYGW